MTAFDDASLELKLRTGLGTPPSADFEAWRSRHSEAVVYLNPVVTAMHYRRRQTLVRIAGAAAAVAIVATVATWVFATQERSFAQTIDAINKAETIAWRIAWYDRMHSLDGKRTWLRAAPRWERAYMAPHRWRDVRYGEDGAIASVDIEDAALGRVLHLNMKTKEAILTNEPSGQFGLGNPFDGVAKILETKAIEFVGQRDIDGAKVNVFRHLRKLQSGDREGVEIWLDATSKRLVGYSTTRGDDYFDPGTDADRNNPAEEQFSKGTIAGVMHRDIVLDAQLDPALFSLTPPEGFSVVEPPSRPKITEELMIEWLRLSARANDGTFLELDRGWNREWHNAIANKAEADRSAVEQEYMTVAHRHILDGNYRPLEEFAAEFTERRSFRYLGQGVTLGNGDRMICFYQLKGSGKYRAIYGDLRVADIEPEELPLPVE
jgi:hypothetical protein